MSTENTQSSIAEFKNKKRQLGSKIAEAIREFNRETGEEIATCEIEYIKPSLGTTQRGMWLHANGGCIIVHLHVKGL